MMDLYNLVCFNKLERKETDTDYVLNSNVFTNVYLNKQMSHQFCSKHLTLSDLFHCAAIVLIERQDYPPILVEPNIYWFGFNFVVQKNLKFKFSLCIEDTGRITSLYFENEKTSVRCGKAFQRLKEIEDEHLQYEYHVV